MACLTTEKSSPLTQQKRCSLPGPMGSLNLYATHQQRRLSERGLMIYRPNKPDIDLIRDFTNSSKKSTPSFLHDRDPGSSGYPQQQRRHSTAVNLMASTSSAVTTPSSSTGWPGNYTTERRHSSIIPCTSSAAAASSSSASNLLGSANVPSSNNNNPPYVQYMSPGQSGKILQQVKPSIHPPPSTLSNSGSASINAGGGGGSLNNFNQGGNPSFASNNSDSSGNKGNNGSSVKQQQNASTFGCRKVRLRIQKNPGAKDKFFELTPIFGRPTIGSVGDGADDEEAVSYLRRPHGDIRRFSDSAATVRHPPHICITPDGSGRSVYNKDSGIVCSTGDLLTLKCLTSSAQEIRFAESNSSQVTSVSDLENSSPQSLGNRSKSFDATIAMARKGPGSSWFSRRHQPIAVKLPLPINSPTISSPGDTRYFPGSAAGILRTPLLTITNENASKSELIEIPSPPAATPASSRNSPEEKTKSSKLASSRYSSYGEAKDSDDAMRRTAWATGRARKEWEKKLGKLDVHVVQFKYNVVEEKVAWDRNGFVLDAAVLGIAIENHLRKVDMRRRATFSALYQPPPIYLESKVPTRARSASACVIPIFGSIGGEDDGAGGSRGRSTSSRKSSLSSATGPGGRLLGWERGAGPSGSSSSSGMGTAGPLPTATTTVSFTGSSTAGQSSSYETYLHRLPMSMGMSGSVYMNNMDSPSSDSFVNFRATEDDIEEENLIGGEEDEEEDEEVSERKAFLPNQQQQQAKGSSNMDYHQQTKNQKKNNSSSSGTGSSGSGGGGAFSQSTLRPNEGNHSSASPAPGSNNSSRGNGMSICSAIRDFILQTIRS